MGNWCHSAFMGQAYDKGWSEGWMKYGFEGSMLLLLFSVLVLRSCPDIILKQQDEIEKSKRNEGCKMFYAFFPLTDNNI